MRVAAEREIPDVDVLREFPFARKRPRRERALECVCVCVCVLAASRGLLIAATRGQPCPEERKEKCQIFRENPEKEG